MGLFYPYREKRNDGKLGLDPKRQNAPVHGMVADHVAGAGAAAAHGGRCPPISLHQNDNDVLMGFADAGYLSDPHKGRSQTGYVFTMGSTAISWRSTMLLLPRIMQRLFLYMKLCVNAYG